MVADQELINNMNVLNDNAFHFEIKELPSTSFFGQSFSLPGLTIGQAIVSTPLIDYPVPGEKMEFEPLNFTFLVDEHLTNWNEVRQWMVALAFPTTTDEFLALSDADSTYTEVSDIHIASLTNKFNPNKKITFVDAFPVGLSGIEFIHNNDTINHPIATATFAYSYYYFTDLT